MLLGSEDVGETCQEVAPAMPYIHKTNVIMTTNTPAECTRTHLRVADFGLADCLPLWISSPVVPNLYIMKVVESYSDMPLSHSILCRHYAISFEFILRMLYRFQPH